MEEIDYLVEKEQDTLDEFAEEQAEARLDSALEDLRISGQVAEKPSFEEVELDGEGGAFSDPEEYRPPYQLVIVYDENDGKFNGDSVEGMATIIKRGNHFLTDAFSGELFVFISHSKYGGTYIEARQSIANAIVNVATGLGKEKKWSGLNKAKEVYNWINNSGLQLLENPDIRHVNVANGLIYLTPSGEIIDFIASWNPEYFTTVKLPVSYNPNATCPAWEKFVNEVFPEDAQQIAWEIAALLMVPLKNKAASAIILKGPKNTGKSTFQNAITAFIGKSNISNLSLEQFGERFQDSQLKGKLVNIVGELPAIKLSAKTVNVLKRLIGNDMLSGEIKNGPSFMFESYARCLFSCNEMPTCDSDDAFFDRFNIIPFNRKQFSKDPLKEQEINDSLSSPEELSGLLNMALRHLPKVITKGITASISMMEELEEIRIDNDPIYGWFHEHIEPDEEGKLLFVDLHKHYRDREPKDTKRASAVSFGRMMKKILQPMGIMKEQFLLADGSRPYGYRGVRLKESAEVTEEADLSFDLESLTED